MSKEMLTIFDESLKPIGKAPREEAHLKGLLHEVVHCWVVSKTPQGNLLYFQQRAKSKKEFPLFYDTAVGGHVDAGEAPLHAVCREMREEIGIPVSPEELAFLGSFREDYQWKSLNDKEIVHVYLYDHPTPVFAIGEEVLRMIQVPLQAWIQKELYKEACIPAFTLDGQAFSIQRDECCPHFGEFERFILPYFQKQ